MAQQSTIDQNRTKSILGTDDVSGQSSDILAKERAIYVHIASSSASGTGLAAIGSYQVNHLDDGSTTPNVLYIGMEKDDGTYAIKKFDETSSTLPVVTYATIGDNPSRTTYTLAWTNRATLSYGLYSVAF